MKHHHLYIRVLSAILCVVLILGLCACGDSKMSQSQLFAMDTAVTFTAYGKNASSGIQAAESVFKTLDAALDPEDPNSTVFAINHAQGASTAISGQIANMVNTAKTVYNRSGGALDLTVYPFVELWGFVDSKFYVPTGEQLLDTLQYICFDKIVLDTFPVSGTYTLTIPATGKMTFAAVGRGSASDYAIEAMAKAGVTSGIVSMEGNVQTLGLKPDGSLWDVAITDPNQPDTFVGTLEVGQKALATTGPYTRQFTDIGTGNTYNHIIRPNSGYTVNNSLKSVTIISDNGTLADCLSTACYVMGSTGALNYWRSFGKQEQDGFEMILITENNEIICTSGLIEQFTLTSRSYTLKYTE